MSPAGTGDGGSGRTPSVDDTTDAPYHLDWQGDAPGTVVTATITGGAYEVDTADLDAFASALTTAAGWFDDARRHALSVRAEVEAAQPPTEPDPWKDPGPLTLRTCISSTAGGDGNSNGFGAQAFIDQPGVASCSSWGPPAPSGTFEFNIAQNIALADLDALIDGAGSLADVAQTLHDLADDVTRCSEVYRGAETDATADTGLPGTVALWHDYFTRMSQDGIADEALFGFIMFVNFLTLGGAILPDGVADAFDTFNVILDSSDLGDWVRDDLLFLVVLVIVAGKARTGSEAAVIETYLAQTAEHLDPAISAQLPDQIQVGSRLVPTSSLSPMERVAAYLAMRSADHASNRYGTQAGLTITPRGGAPVRVATSPADPLGLGGAAAVGAPPPGDAEETEALGGPADVIRYSDRVQAGRKDDSTGVISVLRTDHADGTTSWVVVVPGTADWGLGGPNPQDLLTNFQAVSGMPTDMETAVVAAMQQAGVGPNDPVGLYGHSQGGIVVTRLAGDPGVNEHYNVTTLLTAGSPVGGIDLPDSVSALHLENGSDAVPSLDAAPNPSSPHRITVSVNTTDTGIAKYPHHASHYAQALENMPDDPNVEAWNAQMRGLTGAGEEGAVTTAYVFDIERERMPRDAGDSSHFDVVQVAPQGNGSASRF